MPQGERIYLPSTTPIEGKRMEGPSEGSLAPTAVSSVGTWYVAAMTFPIPHSLTSIILLAALGACSEAPRPQAASGIGEYTETVPPTEPASEEGSLEPGPSENQPEDSEVQSSELFPQVEKIQSMMADLDALGDL
ncbi:MAG: hypothetical protein AAGG01_17780, partial [Planctomycetota bacterium]